MNSAILQKIIELENTFDKACTGFGIFIFGTLVLAAFVIAWGIGTFVIFNYMNISVNGKRRMLVISILVWLICLVSMTIFGYTSVNKLNTTSEELSSVMTEYASKMIIIKDGDNYTVEYEGETITVVGFDLSKYIETTTYHITFTSNNDATDVIELDCDDVTLSAIISTYEQLGYTATITAIE